MSSTSSDPSRGLHKPRTIALEHPSGMNDKPRRGQEPQSIQRPMTEERRIFAGWQSQPEPPHIKEESHPGQRNTHEAATTADDDDELSLSDLDDIAEDENSPQTAADRRAEKRRMKRFRLTHNQTRYLMAEFARQPHPDTAQRERLSQDIPGLSSRQVQVWYQNRRAKLKRLTAPDREQMMQSRALPENFDRSTALHPTSRVPQANLIPSMSPYGSTEYGHISTDVPSFGHRRDLSGETSTTSATSIFSEPLWSPGSLASSQIDSPLLCSDERSFYTSSFNSHIRGPLQAASYIRSQSHPSLPGSPTHSAHRSRAGSLFSTPLPSSTQSHHGRCRSAEMQLPSASNLWNRSSLSGSRFEQRLQGIHPYSPRVEAPDIVQSQAHMPPGLQHSSSVSASAYHAGLLDSSEGETQPYYPFLLGFPINQDPQSLRPDQDIPPHSVIGYTWSTPSHLNMMESSAGSLPTQYMSQLPSYLTGDAPVPMIESQENSEYADSAATGLGLPHHVFDFEGDASGAGHS